MSHHKFLPLSRLDKIFRGHCPYCKFWKLETYMGMCPVLIHSVTVSSIIFPNTPRDEYGWHASELYITCKQSGLYKNCR